MIAVAAPAAIVAALFALLFLLAWQQWGTAVTNTLNVNLPIIGNVIGHYVSDALNITYQALVYWLDALITPLTELIVRPIAAIENTIGSVATLGANTYNAVWSIVNVRIPNAIRTAENFTQGEINSLTAYAQQLYNASIAYAAAGLANLTAYAQQLYNSAIAYTVAQISSLTAYAQQLYNSAITHADQVGATVLADAEQLYNHADAFTRQAYDAATSYAESLAVIESNDLARATVQLEGYADATAQAAVGALVTDIDQGIAAALGGIYTDVDAAITDVIGIIGTGDAAVLEGIRAIPFDVPLDLAGVTALAGATALTLTRFLRDCGIPNCQDLSQFGQELQALLGIVEDAAFLTFLLELIHNPSAAPGIVQSTFGSSITTGLDAAKSLLGV